MKKLWEQFSKENGKRKKVLIAALVAFAATLLPWASVSMGTFGNYSTNGWHSFGLLTVLASLAIIVLWVLPNKGIKISLPADEKMIEKVLVILMLVGPALWLINIKFLFSITGLGLYLALAAGGAAVYFVFQKDK